MYKTLKKVILAAILLISPLAAESTDFSLIGLETGQSDFDFQQTDSGVITDKGTVKLTHVGLKVGTEIENYRAFLSTRIFEATEFDYARAYGVEIQYLFHLSKSTDLFIGLNTGTIDMEYNDQTSDNTITLDNTYYGGDIGFNLRLAEGLDFEVGARVMSINSSESEVTTNYNFDNIVTAYASIILKFPMK